MVSFNCEGCNDVVKKPKLDQHYARCHAPVSCIDCSKVFKSPAEFKSHTSCVTEAEKYEKTLYKGPKTKQNPPSEKAAPSAAPEASSNNPPPSNSFQPRDSRPPYQTGNSRYNQQSQNNGGRFGRPYGNGNPSSYEPTPRPPRNNGSPNFISLGPNARTFGGSPSSTPASNSPPPTPAGDGKSVAQNKTAEVTVSESTTPKLSKAERKKLKYEKKPVVEESTAPAVANAPSDEPTSDSTSKKSKKRKSLANDEPSSTPNASEPSEAEPKRKKSKNDKSFDTPTADSTATPNTEIEAAPSQSKKDKKDKKKSKSSHAADAGGDVSMADGDSGKPADPPLTEDSSALPTKKEKKEKKEKRRKSEVVGDDNESAPPVAAVSTSLGELSVNGVGEEAGGEITKKDKKKKRKEEGVVAEALVASEPAVTSVDAESVEAKEAKKKAKKEKKEKRKSQVVEVAA